MSAIINSLFGNWKTTIAGVIGAIGAYLSTQPGGWGVVGQVLAALGLFLIGAAAKDGTTGSPALKP
jgi:hypothetical protein